MICFQSNKEEFSHQHERAIKWTLAALSWSIEIWSKGICVNEVWVTEFRLNGI